MNFKRKYTFEERQNTANKMLKVYKDRVPVICEPAVKHNLDLSNYRKSKYLVPRDITMGKFLMSFREQLQLQPEIAIFLFVNYIASIGKEILPPTSALVGDIYEKYKDADGFLYIIFSGENFFGI